MILNVSNDAWYIDYMKRYNEPIGVFNKNTMQGTDKVFFYFKLLYKFSTQIH